MNLSPHQQAKLIVAILGDQAEEVLKFLSEESLSTLLKLEQPPLPSGHELNQLITGFMQSVEEVSSVQSIMDPNPSFDLNEEDGNDFLLADESEEDHLNIETHKVEESEDLDDGMNTPEEVSKLLAKEKAQTVAFFINQLEDEEKEKLISFFSDSLKESVLQVKVNKTPFDKQIFKQLHERFYTKETRDDSSETEELKVPKDDAVSDFLDLNSELESIDAQEASDQLDLSKQVS
eukprot:COSAG01_NODE_519_length_16012_cov_4.344058_10_plen_234_part_00